MFCPVTNQERKLPIVGLHVWIVLLSVMALLSLRPALAQSASDEVHIFPRSSPGPRVGDRAVLKANVDLVLVNVTVTDNRDRVISDLRANDFFVLDDKHRQQIRYFSSEDVPLSLVVVLDSSGSMRNKYEQARSAAKEFFQCSNPLDEFALVTFADRPRILAEANGSLSEIESALTLVQPGGETALWDAVYLGLQRLRSARYPRKALLLISDGGDNHSRYSQREIKSVLQEADVQLYAIDIIESFPRRREETSGLLALDEIASTTGGRVWLTHDASELQRAVRRISDDLRSQYVLGYLPGPSARDGKWHRIKVELNVPKSRKLRAYAKKGYYGLVEP
jgi:Ca-activated chloride channel family protein